MELLDMKLKGTETTPERLVIATQYLLARYGYAGTTTRMIANAAGVAQSAISFHFENKENLVREAMERAASYMTAAYGPLADEINRYLDSTAQPEREQVWHYIDRLLSTRVHTALTHRVSHIMCGLAQYEDMLPEQSRGILSQVISHYSEEVLTRLILALDERLPKSQAIIVSRSVFGAIMTFLEKPLLLARLCDELGAEMDVDTLEDGLHRHLMESVAAAVSPVRKI